jgi:hypothetical protein
VEQRQANSTFNTMAEAERSSAMNAAAEIAPPEAESESTEAEVAPPLGLWSSQSVLDGSAAAPESGDAAQEDEDADWLLNIDEKEFAPDPAPDVQAPEEEAGAAAAAAAAAMQVPVAPGILPAGNAANPAVVRLREENETRIQVSDSQVFPPLELEPVYCLAPHPIPSHCALATFLISDIMRSVLAFLSSTSEVITLAQTHRGLVHQLLRSPARRESGLLKEKEEGEEKPEAGRKQQQRFYLWPAHLRFIPIRTVAQAKCLAECSNTHCFSDFDLSRFQGDVNELLHYLSFADVRRLRLRMPDLNPTHSALGAAFVARLQLFFQSPSCARMHHLELDISKEFADSSYKLVSWLPELRTLRLEFKQWPQKLAAEILAHQLPPQVHSMEFVRHHAWTDNKELRDLCKQLTEVRSQLQERDLNIELSVRFKLHWQKVNEPIEWYGKCEHIDALPALKECCLSAGVTFHCEALQIRACNFHPVDELRSTLQLLRASVPLPFHVKFHRGDGGLAAKAMKVLHAGWDWTMVRDVPQPDKHKIDRHFPTLLEQLHAEGAELKLKDALSCAAGIDLSTSIALGDLPLDPTLSYFFYVLLPPTLLYSLERVTLANSASERVCDAWSKAATKLRARAVGASENDAKVKFVPANKDEPIFWAVVQR